MDFNQSLETLRRKKAIKEELDDYYQKTHVSNLRRIELEYLKKKEYENQRYYLQKKALQDQKHRKDSHEVHKTIDNL